MNKIENIFEFDFDSYNSDSDSDSDIEIITRSQYKKIELLKNKIKQIAMAYDTLYKKSVDESDNIDTNNKLLAENNKLIAENKITITLLKNSNDQLENKIKEIYENYFLLENKIKELNHNHSLLENKLKESINENTFLKNKIAKQENDAIKTQEYYNSKESESIKIIKNKEIEHGKIKNNNLFLKKTVGLFILLTCTRLVYLYGKK